jgi:hypothetical protein
MDNENKDQKSRTNKHLENKNKHKLTFKFGLKEGNLNLERLLLFPHLQKHEGVFGGGGGGVYHFEI